MSMSFGVTGHRNFASDDARLTALVLAEMQRAKAELDPASQAALRGAGTVVSALAEGADRLVARVGLDKLGMALVVPLPMPVDGYMMDFGSDAVKAEFNGLLARAETIIEAPILAPGETWRQYTEDRNHQYAWAGAYLVIACDVLIALWDGKPARGTGGTAHVVDWFLAGTTPAPYGLGSRRLGAGSTLKARRLVHIVPESGEIHRQDVVR